MAQIEKSPLKVLRVIRTRAFVPGIDGLEPQNGGSTKKAKALTRLHTRPFNLATDTAGKINVTTPFGGQLMEPLPLMPSKFEPKNGDYKPTISRWDTLDRKTGFYVKDETEVNDA